MAAYQLDSNDNHGILHLHASSANAMNDRVLQALACDYRVMSNHAVMGMAGIRLGISLPAAALEIFREVVPAVNSAYVLYSGKLFNSAEALKLGLINEAVQSADLLATAWQRLRELSQHAGNPVPSLKAALQRNALTRIQQNAEKMRNEFLEIWFSPVARKKLEEIRDELLSKKQS